MNFLKALQIGSFLLGWLQRASIDGKIDLDEIVELIQGIIRLSDLDVRIDLTKKD